MSLPINLFNTQQTSRHLLEFRAGKMFREGNLVKPDTRKGLIYLNQSPEDSLMHFYWKDRSTNKVEDDLIIFPFEAEFSKVKQSNGRVYILKFQSSSQKLFFWMQEPKADKDEELCKKVNDIINNVHSDDKSDVMDYNQELLNALSESYQQSKEEADNNDNEAGSSDKKKPTTQFSKDQLKEISEILANIQVPETNDANLQDILTPEIVSPLLKDREVCNALFPHLPDNSPLDSQSIEDVLRSPQFIHSINSLTYALRSGALGPLMAELGLDSSISTSDGAVVAFLRAIQKKQDDTMDES
ncbi:adhesion regulating molecule [Anaeromyces robustus]|uniref:Adhesion regulating molecule n=1 Tax=Anaeromyces robustus TaxID=1754192 RepID=A0A1Y1WZG8_9FUNG|nr:adhesion regulating molecule [Anaeromyces robustus]|eukprot:ORX78832.1 adhesion regulating molecule [Anaeromyces robustus]